jgi:rifampicin phosphotransferase
VALTDNIPCGILRRWVVAAGQRLVERGRLTRVDNAVFCTADELAGAFRDDDQNLESLAARRRGEQAWTRANPGPTVVGQLDDPPDLRLLPRHGRRMNEAVNWGLQMEFPGAKAHGDGDEIRGTPASPGTYTGPVRVVRSEADFGALLPGEVLVCPTTSPAWTILFAIAGALVSDGGGPLAHAAIIAREHGLPAVVGTVDATTKLQNGQLATVDGTTGTVTLHPAE